MNEIRQHAPGDVKVNPDSVHVLFELTNGRISKILATGPSFLREFIVHVHVIDSDKVVRIEGKDYAGGDSDLFVTLPEMLSIPLYETFIKMAAQAVAGRKPNELVSRYTITEA